MSYSIKMGEQGLEPKCAGSGPSPADSVTTNFKAESHIKE